MLQLDKKIGFGQKILCVDEKQLQIGEQLSQMDKNAT